MSWAGGLEVVAVFVIAEGQTEEQFIKRVVAPALHPAGIFVKAQTMKTSTDSRGGAVNWDRLKRNARNLLLQHPDAVLTTFLDLYALDTTFPGFQQAKSKTNFADQVEHLCVALHRELVAHVGCRPERFIPHIQAHEFEGLLFSDVAALVRVEPDWAQYEGKLGAIRASFTTPEHINDGFDTKPSARLDKLLRPSYRKTRHGPLAAKAIGLERIEHECPYFQAWMDKLRALSSP